MDEKSLNGLTDDVLKRAEGDYSRMLLLDRNSGKNVYQHETSPEIYLFMSDRGHWQIGTEWEVRRVEVC